MDKTDPAWVFYTAYSLGVPLIVGVFIGLMGLPQGQILILKELLVPVIVASLGGLFVLNQTNEAKKVAKDQETKRHKAVRAVMPLALSAIFEYIETQSKELDVIYDTLENNINNNISEKTNKKP